MIKEVHKFQDDSVEKHLRRVPLKRDFAEKSAALSFRGESTCVQTKLISGETMTDPRFPIGKFHYETPPSEEQREKFIADVAQTPLAMRAAIEGLSQPQLETPYREGGWTVRQVVHHVPDSHMNAYIRFKLALTEDEPTIKPYAEDRWAELADTKSTPIEVSLVMLDSLHQRWVELLRSLEPGDWKRQFRHPEIGVVALEKNVALYSWHGRHHVSHITELRRRMGW